MCDCIDRVNEKLAEHNAEVLVNLLGPKRACIVLWKKDEKKRGKLPILQASYCPFCGGKYEAHPSEPGPLSELLEQKG